MRPIRERDAAAQTLRTALPSEPAVLSEDLGQRVSAAATRDAWQQWAKLVTDAAPYDLAAGAPGAFAKLAASLTQLCDAATRELTLRSEAWQPIASALAAWTELARASQHAADDLTQVKQALAWLKADGQDIRNARLAPFTADVGTDLEHAPAGEQRRTRADPARGLSHPPQAQPRRDTSTAFPALPWVS